MVMASRSKRESEKAMAAKVTAENELRGELFATSSGTSYPRER